MDSPNHTMGNSITVERPGKIPQLSCPRLEPYPIAHANKNGTVTIQKEPNVTNCIYANVAPIPSAQA